MSHTVAIEGFEGPFGVLLDLVERRKLEVTTISVAEITADYMNRIHELGGALSTAELSEFLGLGARLLYIKSLALLPAAANDQTEELRQLNLELGEYRKLQAAARLLQDRAGRPVWPRPVAIRRPAAADRPLPDFELTALTTAFHRALTSKTPELPKAKAPQPVLSLATITTRLRDQIKSGLELETLFQNRANKLEIILTFLALLELVRTGFAHISQAAQFGPIMVEVAD